MLQMIVYLASPYSHDDPDIQDLRYYQTCDAVADMMRQGMLVFSPIAHSHVIAKRKGLGGDWETWKEFDMEMIKRCDEVHVLMLDGWEDSRGIREEITFAGWNGIPVKFIAMNKESEVKK